LFATADPDELEAISSQYRFDPLLYLIAFGFAFVSPAASVAFNNSLYRFVVQICVGTRLSEKSIRLLMSSPLGCCLGKLRWPDGGIEV
jgi:hypothetical protein